MKLNKKSVLVTLSTIFVCVTLIVTTIAYLETRTESKDNEFEFKPAEVEIIERFDGWNVKEVSLKNTSDDINCVVRGMLLPRVLDEDGNYVAVDLGTLGAPVANKITAGDFVFELASDWATNWFYKDGFFYCKKVLAPNETTALLLKKVSLASTDQATKDKYKDLEVKVDVLSDILQAEGGAPSIEWGIVVNGLTVSAS